MVSIGLWSGKYINLKLSLDCPTIDVEPKMMYICMMIIFKNLEFF